MTAVYVNDVGTPAGSGTTATTSFTATLPTYSSGDLVYLHVYGSWSSGSTVTPSLPAGWVIERTVTPSASVNIFLASKMMDGSEGSTVVVTWAGGTATPSNRAHCVSYRNSGGTELSAASGPTTVSNPITGVSITTAAANEVFLVFLTYLTTAPTFAPSTVGVTERWDETRATINSRMVMEELPAPSPGAYQVDGSWSSSGGTMTQIAVSISPIIITSDVLNLGIPVRGLR